MKRELPADFIWGVSASGYQSEGGNVDSNWDRYNASAENQDPYGRSIDFRHRYREDVALARQLGVNTFRLSINWARVEPRPGESEIGRATVRTPVNNAHLVFSILLANK